MVALGTSINHTKLQIFLLNAPIVIQLHISKIIGYKWSSLRSKYMGALRVKNSLWYALWEYIQLYIPSSVFFPESLLWS